MRRVARGWALLVAVLAAQASGPHGAAAPQALRPQAETWAGAPGPAVGTLAPAFEAPDQDGTLRRFETLRGPGGLLLNFNRSVVW
jgi:hypothetical protein